MPHVTLVDEKCGLPMGKRLCSNQPKYEALKLTKFIIYCQGRKWVA